VDGCECSVGEEERGALKHPADLGLLTSSPIRRHAHATPHALHPPGCRQQALSKGGAVGQYKPPVVAARSVQWRLLESRVVAAATTAT